MSAVLAVLVREESVDELQHPMLPHIPDLTTDTRASDLTRGTQASDLVPLERSEQGGGRECGCVSAWWLVRPDTASVTPDLLPARRTVREA